MTGLSRSALWLGAFVILGAGLRGLYLLTPALDSDQAIVGLMARHILQGEFPIFFWGQPFAGTMEAHLAALLFYLFGPSRLTLALSPFLFSLGFLLLTYRLAREAFDQEVGLLALLLAAVPAPFLVSHSVTARSNYIENLLLGSLVLCLTLRVPREPGPRQRRALLLLGFFAGLAWYQSPQSVHYLAASGLFLLLRHPRLLLQRAFFDAAAAFVVGSLPLWIYNLGSGGTFEAIQAQSGAEPLGSSLARYLGAKLPYVLGVTTREEGLGWSAGALILALYAGALGYLVRRWRLPGSQLLLLFLVITSAVVVTGYNRGGGTRYLLPLYSALPVVLAALLVALGRWNRWVCAVAVGALLGANIGGNLVRAEALDARKLGLYAWERARGGELVKFLEAEGLTRVYVSDFWDAYRLTFDAQERIVFAEPIPSFYPSYTRMVDTAERYAYVVKGQYVVESFAENLRLIGAGHRRRRVVGYTVFDAFVPPAGLALRPVPRAEWRTTASHGAAHAGRAFDRDPLTGWRTGEPGRSEAFFQVDLGALRTIGEVTLLPARAADAPRTFRLEVSRDGARWEPALAVTGTWQGLAWVGSRVRVDPMGRIQVRFEPTAARWVRVSLVAASAAGEWSIGELFVAERAPEPAPPVRSPGAAAFRRGLERMAAGRWADAVRAFQEAVDRDPDWPEPYVELVLAAQRLGTDQEDPYERALALERHGLGELAVAQYWKAVQVFPHSNHTHPLLRLRETGGADAGERVRQLLGAFIPPERLKASLGRKIRLLGYALDRREVEPGGQVQISYFWECLAEMDRDYVVFVHLRGDSARLGDDHAPLQGLYPTSRWRKGEIIREDRVIPIPRTIEPGALELSVGVWDPASGERLRVDGAPTPERGDRVPVTRLVVRGR